MLEYKWCINTSKCCDRKKGLVRFFREPQFGAMRQSFKAVTRP